MSFTLPVLLQFPSHSCIFFRKNLASNCLRFSWLTVFALCVSSLFPICYIYFCNIFIIMASSLLFLHLWISNSKFSSVLLHCCMRYAEKIQFEFLELEMWTVNLSRNGAGTTSWSQVNDIQKMRGPFNLFTLKLELSWAGTTKYINT